MNLILTEDVRGAMASVADQVLIALDGATYSPDDIARECEEGTALCFTAVDGGVVVVKMHHNRRLNDDELEVWLAASKEFGAVQNYLPAIEEVARELGASRVIFSSFRRGWLRAPGWKLREMTFERVL